MNVRLRSGRYMDTRKCSRTHQRPTADPGIGIPAQPRRARRWYWAYSSVELAAVTVLIVQLATGTTALWGVAGLITAALCAEGIRRTAPTAFPDPTDTEDTP